MTESYEDEETLKETVKPITFGSTISFLFPIDSKPENNEFLTFPGLLQNEIQIRNFDESKILDIDFSFSLFKILPFDESNFKYQTLIQKDLDQQEDEFRSLGIFFFFFKYGFLIFF